jgi:hypothetical protein
VDAADELLDPVSGERVSLGRVRAVEYEEGDEIRRLMSTLGVFEPALYERMPRNRCLVWEVRRRGLLVGGRARLIVVAAVVNPIRELVRGEAPLPRASFAALARIVRDHLSGDGPTRLAAVFSPTGWEIGLRVDSLRRPGLALHLFEPGIAGGFTPVAGNAERPPAPFDIESRMERIERVVHYVEKHRFELLMKGLGCAEVAREIEMVPEDVRAGFTEAAERDEFLVLDEADDLYLRRA